MLNGTHRHPRQEEVVYGRPAAEVVTAAAAAFGASRLMIVTSRSLGSEGALAARLAAEMGGCVAGVFAGVRAHSPRQDVLEGAARARDLECDLLVAVGGGSVMRGSLSPCGRALPGARLAERVLYPPVCMWNFRVLRPGRRRVHRSRGGPSSRCGTALHHPGGRSDSPQGRRGHPARHDLPGDRLAGRRTPGMLSRRRSLRLFVPESAVRRGRRAAGLRLILRCASGGHRRATRIPDVRRQGSLSLSYSWRPPQNRAG